VASTEQLEPDTRRMLAADREVQVVGDVERALVRARVDARTAGVEGIEHVNGRRVRYGQLIVPGVAPFQVELVERRSPEESLHLRAQLPVAVVAIVRALRQIEPTDAAVARNALLALILEAQCLHIGQRVLDAEDAEGVMRRVRDESEQRAAV